MIAGPNHTRQILTRMQGLLLLLSRSSITRRSVAIGVATCMNHSGTGSCCVRCAGVGIGVGSEVRLRSCTSRFLWNPTKPHFSYTSSRSVWTYIPPTTTQKCCPPPSMVWTTMGYQMQPSQQRQSLLRSQTPYQLLQRRCMARNRSKRRSPMIFMEDHELSPRRPTTTTNGTSRSSDTPVIYDPHIKHHRRHQAKTPRQQREQEIYETEQMLERIHAIVPDQMTPVHLHYCIKQHLWYRATAIVPNEDDDSDDMNDDTNDQTDKSDNDEPPSSQERPSNQPQHYKIDIGLAPRSLESIGDVLLLTLFNNSRKEGGPKLPDLNARRDHLDPYKNSMKTSLPFQEGELLFAIVWEGLEEEKDEQEFYLVTGRNIWRSPIRGVATLNMEYIDRNWTTDPPTVETVLLSIVCTREDYYYKISDMYDGPLIVPDVENSTSGPNRQKKRKDRSRTMVMDNDLLEEHCHPWVSPNDYHDYVEANPP